MHSTSRRNSSFRWLIAAMVGAFAFVSYVQRMNVSVAPELMMPDLGLTKSQMGQIFSSFLVGYALFQVPAGRLGDAIGARITLSLAALVWGCTTLLTGVVPKMFGVGTAALLISLGVLRFLLGASEAATFRVGSRAIRQWSPPREWAIGNAFMMVGSSSAAAATVPLVSWLMLRFGWRAAFSITSGLAFAIAVLWYLAAIDTPEEHKRVSARELELITRYRATTTQAPLTDSSSLRSLLKDRNILILSLSYICEGYVLFVFVFWLYIYLVEVRGFSILSGGLAGGLPWLTALACTPFGGLVCDRITALRGRIAGARAVIMLGYGLSAVLLFAAAKLDSRAGAVATLCLSVGALYFAEPAFWPTAVHLSGENTGAASGIMSTAGILGGIVSTSLTPMIVQRFGWLPALGSGAAVAVACTCVWFVIGRNQQLSTDT